MNNLLYASPLNSLGYGVVGIQVLLQLHKDTNVCCFPIGNVQVDDIQHADVIKKTHYSNHIDFPFYRRSSVEVTGIDYPDILKIWHQNALFERPGKGRFFGWPIFELDRFTDLELISLEQPDELIVCSEWAKDVILSSLPHAKVSVVPLGVDSSVFKPIPYPENEKANFPNNYTFYTIGKLSKNKGHDILASAFNKAFEQSDTVRLEMLTHNPFFTPQENDYWQGLFTKSKLGNKIRFHSHFNTHQDIAKQINKYDCGIFCSRAEGWNLGLLESMACGKPVIATDYSGHTEYCLDENSFLVYIDKDNLEDAHDGKWFNGQGKWATLGLEQEEQLIEHMRFCYENCVTENLSGQHTANVYSWENTGRELRKVLWNT